MRIQRQQAHGIKPDWRRAGGVFGGIGAGSVGDGLDRGAISNPVGDPVGSWLPEDQAQRWCVGLHMDTEHTRFPRHVSPPPVVPAAGRDQSPKPSEERLISEPAPLAMDATWVRVRGSMRAK